MTSPACNQIHMSSPPAPPPSAGILSLFFNPPMTLSPHSSLSLFISCPLFSLPSVTLKCGRSPSGWPFLVFSVLRLDFYSFPGSCGGDDKSGCNGSPSETGGTHLGSAPPAPSFAFPCLLTFFQVCALIRAVLC